MNKLKKRARAIEVTDFDVIAKLGFSVIISMFWIFLLTFLSRMWQLLFSDIVPSVFWLMITLPIFGVLYHKLFTLIDAEKYQDSDPTEIHNTKRKEQFMIGNKLVFGKDNYTNLPILEERLRLLKSKVDKDPMSTVQILNGDSLTALGLFQKVFGNDPDSLIVNCLFDMRAATPQLKYLYIDTSTVDERDLNDIALQIKRINEIKLCGRARSLSKKEGENVDERLPR